MKLAVAVNELTLSGATTNSEFRIRNSAKAFKILSDGLYSNKIRAVVRELGCNAYDSHVAAGKKDVPFTVHLPTVLEPYFAVQDYGLGLDGEQVENIYTTYFESTKTGSNDFVGALGLGSKSPFSYTENFTVTAIKDGVKRIYSAFINENGVPSIAEMDKSLTDECNGVEVKFSVVDRHDYNTFVREAQFVFRHFKVLPEFRGQTVNVTPPTYAEENIVPGVHVGDRHDRTFAIMGNIEYPLVNMPERDKYLGPLAMLLNCNLILEFDIGDLDFAASREELSYVPQTIDSIRKKLESVNARLQTHIAAQADAIECMWARAEFLYNRASTQLYNAAVKQYVIDTNFPLYALGRHHGQATITVTKQFLENNKLQITAFRHSTYSYSSIYPGQTVTGVAYEVTVSPEIVIVLNDLKIGCATRARRHYAATNTRVSAYCVTCTEKDPVARQVAFDQLLALLHNPPTVIMASTLKETPKKALPLSGEGIVVATKKTQNYYNRHAIEYSWTTYDDAILDSTTYYYVCMNNSSPITAAGAPLAFNALMTSVRESGLPALANITVMGVRKSRIKDLQGRPNWINLEDKIQSVVRSVPAATLHRLCTRGLLDTNAYAQYTSKEIAAGLSPNSPYVEFVNMYVTPYSAVPIDSDPKELVRLCERYGRTFSVEAVTAKLIADRDAITYRYPLIKYLSCAPCSAVAEYVNLIDNKGKSNV